MPCIVSMLEELLTEAKAGRVRAVAIAYTAGQTCDRQWHYADGERFALLGTLAQLQFEMLEDKP